MDSMYLTPEFMATFNSAWVFPPDFLEGEVWEWQFFIGILDLKLTEIYCFSIVLNCATIIFHFADPHHKIQGGGSLTQQASNCGFWCQNSANSTEFSCAAIISKFTSFYLEIQKIFLRLGPLPLWISVPGLGSENLLPRISRRESVNSEIMTVQLLTLLAPILAMGGGCSMKTTSLYLAKSISMIENNYNWNTIHSN